MLFLLNFLSVFLYGFFIMFYFLNIKFDTKNRITIAAYVAIAILLQIVLFLLGGKQFVEKVYPLAFHLPLLIFCWKYFNKRFDSSLFALCFTYILTTPRKWIGDLFALALHNNSNASLIIQIIITLPLLIIIYRYLRPYINKLLVYSDEKIRILLIIPFIYYVIAYLTTVYTQLLYTSKIVVVGILTIGLTLTFFYYFVVYFNEMEKRFHITTEQNILSVQLNDLHARTELLKHSEENAIIQRHNLRHHLQLINGYLATNQIPEAQSYILEIENNMYHEVVVQYCENNAVNLILSSYITMAKNENISVQSHVILPNSCEVADMDLCIILANAIENAINACRNIKSKNDRFINIDCNIKNNKHFIQVTNSYIDAITFEKGLPITNRENHGFGTKSIVAIVHKYHGIFSFTAEEGIFKMNIII